MQENKELPKRRRVRKQTSKDGSTDVGSKSVVKTINPPPILTNDTPDLTSNPPLTITLINDPPPATTLTSDPTPTISMSSDLTSSLSPARTLTSDPTPTISMSSDLTSSLSPARTLTSDPTPTISMTSDLTSGLSPARTLTSCLSTGLTGVSSPGTSLTSNIPPAKLVCHSQGSRQQLLIPDLISRKFAHNLMPLQEEMIREALGPGTVDEIIVKGYGIVLQRRDIWTLNSCRWLNDQVSKPLYFCDIYVSLIPSQIQVINFYMHLIMERFGDVFVYNTFFYLKLLNHGFHAVCNWHKEVDKFSKRLLIFPVHLEECAHWCLAVGDVAKKQVLYFDSLNKRNLTCLKVLSNYLQELSGETYSTMQYKNIPIQTNSYDCGIFTCMYARCLAENTAFCFSQQDTPAIRRHMVLELLYKTLF